MLYILVHRSSSACEAAQVEQITEGEKKKTAYRHAYTKNIHEHAEGGTCPELIYEEFSHLQLPFY